MLYCLLCLLTKHIVNKNLVMFDQNTIDYTEYHVIPYTESEIRIDTAQHYSWDV